MFSLDFLYYSLGVGFLILIGFLCYAIYHLTQSIKSMNTILNKVDNVTDSIELISNQVKFGLFHLAGRFLKKGGDLVNGKKRRKKV